MQPPPARVVFQALVTPNRDPARQWLILLDDEVEPRVLEAVEPTLVVWSSLWTERPEAQVRFHIGTRSGAASVTWSLLDVDDPGPALVKHACKRINELINRDLRYSFGQ